MRKEIERRRERREERERKKLTNDFFLEKGNI
jgi:hypothetical protein